MHIHAYAKCVTRKHTHTHLDPEIIGYTQYTEPGHTKIKCMVIYINYIYITDIQKARDKIFGNIYKLYIYNRHTKSKGPNIWEIIDFIRLQIIMD